MRKATSKNVHREEDQLESAICRSERNVKFVDTTELLFVMLELYMCARDVILILSNLSFVCML